MAENNPRLYWGCTSEHVKILQSVLNEITRGPMTKLVVDGIFGRLTYEAVKLFQRETKIKIDGVVGPQTWGEIEKKIGTVGQKGRRGPQLPAVSGYAVQRTPDDCGYFSHYALAEANLRHSLNISFTEKSVLDARDRFLRSTGRSGVVYLAPDFAVDYMKLLGCAGFKKVFAKHKFEPNVPTVDVAKYLYGALGSSGLCMALNKFKGSSADGHWIAVLGAKNFQGTTYFFVYDSSCHIPRSVYLEPKTNITICWVSWHPFATYLKDSLVGSIIMKL